MRPGCMTVLLPAAMFAMQSPTATAQSSGGGLPPAASARTAPVFAPGVAPPVANSRPDARYGDPQHTDFSGLWANDRFTGLIDYSKPLPLTKSYAARLKAFRKRVEAGHQPPD